MCLVVFVVQTSQLSSMDVYVLPPPPPTQAMTLLAAQLAALLKLLQALPEPEVAKVLAAEAAPGGSVLAPLLQLPTSIWLSSTAARHAALGLMHFASSPARLQGRQAQGRPCPGAAVRTAAKDIVSNIAPMLAGATPSSRYACECAELALVALGHVGGCKEGAEAVLDLQGGGTGMLENVAALLCPPGPRLPPTSLTLVEGALAVVEQVVDYVAGECAGPPARLEGLMGCLVGARVPHALLALQAHPCDSLVQRARTALLRLAAARGSGAGLAGLRRAMRGLPEGKEVLATLMSCLRPEGHARVCVDLPIPQPASTALAAVATTAAAAATAMGAEPAAAAVTAVAGEGAIAAAEGAAGTATSAAAATVAAPAAAVAAVNEAAGAVAAGAEAAAAAVAAGPAAEAELTAAATTLAMDVAETSEAPACAPNVHAWGPELGLLLRNAGLPHAEASGAWRGGAAAAAATACMEGGDVVDSRVRLQLRVRVDSAALQGAADLLAISFHAEAGGGPEALRLSALHAMFECLAALGSARKPAPGAVAAATPALEAFVAAGGAEVAGGAGAVAEAGRGAEGGGDGGSTATLSILAAARVLVAVTATAGGAASASDGDVSIRQDEASIAARMVQEQLLPHAPHTQQQGAPDAPPARSPAEVLVRLMHSGGHSTPLVQAAAQTAAQVCSHVMGFDQALAAAVVALPDSGQAVAQALVGLIRAHGEGERGGGRVDKASAVEEEGGGEGREEAAGGQEVRGALQALLCCCRSSAGGEMTLAVAEAGLTPFLLWLICPTAASGSGCSNGSGDGGGSSQDHLSTLARQLLDQLLQVS